MTESVGCDLMIQIMSLKKEVDFALKAAEDCIIELEDHKANVHKLGMQNESKQLEKHIMDIRRFKADIDTGVSLNLETLAADIEAEDMQVAKQMASTRDSKRKSDESIKIDQYESAISAIKAAPDFMRL